MVSKKSKNVKPFEKVQFEPKKLAYLAGIIDGEGCFHICLLNGKKYDGYISDHYRGVLKIDNTDKRLIDWLNESFSGTSSAVTRTTSSRKFERPVYSWTVTGFRLLDLCEQVLPYLVVKKKHCENMIIFKETYPKVLTGRGNKILSKETLDFRRQCLEESRKLNSRFHLHPLKPTASDEVLGPCCPSALSSEEFQVN